MIIQRSVFGWISASLLALTSAFFMFLTSSPTLADTDVVTSTAITIEESCTLSGITDTDHTADLVNGTYSGASYANGIGQTTLKTFCNDDAGYAIYAIGYTNNEYGNTTMHWDRAESLNDTTNAINTGVYISGTTTSSTWSMKLASVNGTYVTTIDDGVAAHNNSTENFTTWHTIPSEYKRVAYSTSGTDLNIDGNGIGSSITVTYDAFVSTAQPAGSYTGQVKYTLVHPNSAATPLTGDQVGVIYHDNGLGFAGGATTNRVVYAPVGQDKYLIVDSEYEISKSSNVDENGNVTDYRPESDYGVLNWVEMDGAEVIKIVLTYDTPTNDSYIEIDYGVEGDHEVFHGSGVDREFYIDDGYSESAGFNYYCGGINADDYCYYYAKVYSAQHASSTDAGAEYAYTIYPITPIIGTYTETSTWRGKWYGEVPYCGWGMSEYECSTTEMETKFFESEAEVIKFIELLKQYSSSLGITLDLYAYNPYSIYYNGNGATAGTMEGFYTPFMTNTADSVSNLMAYNFKKNGYGFAGWSADSNATVGGNSRIYGPNEKIYGNELTFDNNKGTTLYAVWVPTSGTMQGWTGCSSLNSGQVIALTDNRDGNVYTVGKMQDGNCWMMENLRLDNTATTLSGDNTNSPVASFTALAATSDNWCSSVDESCTNQSYINTNNTNIGGANTSGTTLIVSPGLWNGNEYDMYYDGSERNSQWYGYGNYYNWYSATAGNGTYSIRNSSVAGSICPNGWHLPTGSTNGQFIALNVAMGGRASSYDSDEYGGEEIVSNRWRSYPNNFVYSGLWGSYDAGSRGEYGDYWSRTAGSNRNDAVGWGFNYSSNGSYAIGKRTGSTVRCITLGS